MHVCDDGCVVETEGGVEDKQREKEKDRNPLFHSKISKLKATEEGVDWMPVCTNGRNANS